jgi:CubicO group peptidase (beta-lactamase class C family)
MKIDLNRESPLAELFRSYDRADAPGAALSIIEDGQILSTKTCGLANLEENIPVTMETNFRLASLTKQFTAMSVMILAHRQKLSFENSLADFFPDFPAYSRSITLRHLLNHTSGLLDYETLIPPDTAHQLHDADVLHLLKQQSQTQFPPGDQFKYSNSGYAFLALTVEKVSSLSFTEFLHKNIFHPLGMFNTIAYIEGITTIPHRAYGYSPTKNSFERTDQNLTSAVLGDGGIYSSISDLHKWSQALDTNPLVSKELLQQAFTPGRLNNDEKIRYRFGWELNTYRGLKIISHSGSTICFRNFIAHIPDAKLTIILLTNRSSPLPESILDVILNDLPTIKPKESADLSLARRLLGIVPLDPF